MIGWFGTSYLFLDTQPSASSSSPVASRPLEPAPSGVEGYREVQHEHDW
jgi:hypothetical protein